MLSRLETMVLSEEAVPLDAIRHQIASAIDIIIHVARLRDGSRKIAEISEIDGVGSGSITLNKLFEFCEECGPDSGAYSQGGEANVQGGEINGQGGEANVQGGEAIVQGGAVKGSFRYTGNTLKNTMKLSLAGLKSIYSGNNQGQ
jgi:hypothetical protein